MTDPVQQKNCHSLGSPGFESKLKITLYVVALLSLLTIGAGVVAWFLPHSSVGNWISRHFNPAALIIGGAITGVLSALALVALKAGSTHEKKVTEKKNAAALARAVGLVPDDVWKIILKDCDLERLVSMERVCKRLYFLVHGEYSNRFPQAPCPKSEALLLAGRSREVPFKSELRKFYSLKFKPDEIKTFVYSVVVVNQYLVAFSHGIPRGVHSTNEEQRKISVIDVKTGEKKEKNFDFKNSNWYFNVSGVHSGFSLELDGSLYVMDKANVTCFSIPELTIQRTVKMDFEAQMIYKSKGAVFAAGISSRSLIVGKISENKVDRICKVEDFGQSLYPPIKVSGGAYSIVLDDSKGNFIFDLETYEEIGLLFDKVHRITDGEFLVEKDGSFTLVNALNPKKRQKVSSEKYKEKFNENWSYAQETGSRIIRRSKFKNSLQMSDGYLLPFGEMNEKLLGFEVHSPYLICWGENGVVVDQILPHITKLSKG